MILRNQDLIKHIKKFSSGNQAIKLFTRTRYAIQLYSEECKKGAYGRTGKLHSRVLIGKQIKKQRNQRRLISIYIPKNSVGRPKKNEVRVLVSFLAAALRSTTKFRITLNREGTPPSNFERFLTPILYDIGIFDVRGWISEHLKQRNKA